jgi:hypothetical protein
MFALLAPSFAPGSGPFAPAPLPFPSDALALMLFRLSSVPVWSSGTPAIARGSDERDE